MVVTVVKAGQVVVAGDDYVFDLTLKKNGVIEPTFLAGGAVATASIGPGGTATSNIIIDHAIAITDAPNGLATLILSGAETLLLTPGPGKRPSKTIVMYGDVKVIESGGNETHCGPFSFEVRGAIT